MTARFDAGYVGLELEDFGAPDRRTVTLEITDQAGEVRYQRADHGVELELIEWALPGQPIESSWRRSEYPTKAELGV